jgi:hypothetical protein
MIQESIIDKQLNYFKSNNKSINETQIEHVQGYYKSY